MNKTCNIFYFKSIKTGFVLKRFLSVNEARTAATATAAAAAASNLLEVFVDGIPVMVEPGTTVLQVTW